NPVPDPKKAPEGMTEGLAADWLIAGLRQKMEYELDAFQLHRSFLVPQIAAMSQAMGAYARLHPTEVGPQGTYRLLGLDNPQTSYAVRYLDLEVLRRNDGRAFNPAAELAYYGQLVPVEIVAGLAALNTRLEGAGMADTAAIRNTLPGWIADWKKYMVDSKV